METAYDKQINHLRAMANGSHQEKCEGCEYEEDFPPCVSCITKALNGAANSIEKLQSELKTCRNELCLRCGNYREAHKGACDGCRFKDIV